MELTHPERVREYLKTCTVGIAGCGGLGSTCAVNLARAGVGRLILADFDIVTKENLSRQYYFSDQIGMLKVHALKANILRANPDVTVKAFDLKLCTSDVVELFNGVDVIVEAFDKAEMKQMIIETTLLHLPGKPIIAGVGLAGWGNTDSLKVQRSGNLIVCGDQTSEVTYENPLTAPRVGIVANMEANEVISLLISRWDEEQII
jgi:sulfur carrier protein ThiS adenylyltransferase